MKSNFFESSLCTRRNVCDQCRLHRDYREVIDSQYDVPEIDFECPHGIVAEEFTCEDASALDKMINFAGALSRQGKARLEKRKTKASEAVQAKRWSLCKAPCKRWDGANKCGKCGCSDLALKISWATEFCPLGKWLKEK